MGLQNRSSNLSYVRLKDGKFFLNKDSDKPYDQLEGTITKMYFKNEDYKGTPQRKLIVVISDSGENYHIGLNVESASYTTLVSFLKNVDISKPLTLHPKMEMVNRNGEDYPKRSILVSQNGTYAKSYFSKANPNGLPEWSSVKVGNKTVTDKSEFTDFLEKFVTENYIPFLSEPDNEGEKPAIAAAKPAPKALEPFDEGYEDEEEKLPWD